MINENSVKSNNRYQIIEKIKWVWDFVKNWGKRVKLLIVALGVIGGSVFLIIQITSDSYSINLERGLSNETSDEILTITNITKHSLDTEIEIIPIIKNIIQEESIIKKPITLSPNIPIIIDFDNYYYLNQKPLPQIHDEDFKNNEHPLKYSKTISFTNCRFKVFKLKKQLKSEWIIDNLHEGTFTRIK